ncbi:MAG TPA: twin-arginine translocase TatA/TatE family subunit [Chloroflexia bacterium]|nr:twin-arginine translocase TatA/TatE family subunit [Chloroflexia bacterium]
MPFGLQAPELLIILAIILVIFGAGKLPQVFGSLGKGVREFREATEGKETAAQPPATTAPAVTTTTTTPPASSTTVTTQETRRQDSVTSDQGSGTRG